MIQKSEIRNQKSEDGIKQPLFKNGLFLFSVFCLLFSAIGCDAFVRKFTRKPKREVPKEEFILAPEEYKTPQIPKDELYQKYFLFWKSWHDELINSLSVGANHKKQIYCVNEAIKNLGQMRVLLSEIKQEELDAYINQMQGLKDSLIDDPYGNVISKNRLAAERIKRNILRDFSYRKTKEYLI